MAIEAKVAQIYIAREAGAPMERLTHVQANPGGLEGNAYTRREGFYQTVANPKQKIRDVSLISQQAIDAANAEFGTTWDGPKSRRNLIVNGEVDLLELEGKVFMIGDVLMRGDKECAPCVRPTWLLEQHGGSETVGFERAFRKDGRGGIRAEILTSGIIFEGDPLIVLGCNAKK